MKTIKWIWWYIIFIIIWMIMSGILEWLNISSYVSYTNIYWLIYLYHTLFITPYFVKKDIWIKKI